MPPNVIARCSRLFHVVVSALRPSCSQLFHLVLSTFPPPSCSRVFFSASSTFRTRCTQGFRSFHRLFPRCVLASKPGDTPTDEKPETNAKISKRRAAHNVGVPHNNRVLVATPKHTAYCAVDNFISVVQSREASCGSGRTYVCLHRWEQPQNAAPKHIRMPLLGRTNALLAYAVVFKRMIASRFHRWLNWSNRGVPNIPPLRQYSSRANYIRAKQYVTSRQIGAQNAHVAKQRWAHEGSGYKRKLVARAHPIRFTISRKPDNSPPRIHTRQFTDIDTDTSVTNGKRDPQRLQHPCPTATVAHVVTLDHAFRWSYTWREY